MSGPPRRYQWVRLLDSAGDSDGCPSSVDIVPLACVGSFSPTLIEPWGTATGFEMVPEAITLERLEIDLWFSPDLSSVDCASSEVTLEFRAGLIKQEGTSGNPIPPEPQFFGPIGAGGTNMTDWSSQRFLHRWHHSWERTSGCTVGESTARADITGTFSGEFPGKWFPSVATPTLVNCTSPSGVIASFDQCPGNPGWPSLSAAFNMTAPTYESASDTFFEPHDWHLRLRMKRRLVFKSYDSLLLSVQWGDPFSTGSPRPDATPMNVYGDIRGLVSIG